MPKVNRNIDMKIAAVAAAATAVGAAITAATDGNPGTVPDWGVAASATILAVAIWRARSEAQHNRDKKDGST